MKCVVSIWALPVREAVKVCQDGLRHFFPTLPGGVGACQDGLEHFFSTFVRLTEGAGFLSDLGNDHIDPTHFKKGPS